MGSLVSVIIPAYNAEKYIKDTLFSVFNQTYKDWELILINDGSTDDTRSIVESIIAPYSNVTVVNKTNSGVSDSRNVGISKASGKYIMFIDSDDKVKADYIEHHVEELERNNGELVISTINETYSFVPGVYNYSEIYNNRNLVWGQPWCKLFMLDIIKKHKIEFNTSLSLCEDWIFTMDYLDHIDKIVITNYIGYEWNRDNPNSLSQKGSYEHRIDCYDVALERLRVLYEHKGVKDLSFITKTRMNNWRLAINSMYDKKHNCTYSLKIKRIYSYLEKLNGHTTIIGAFLFDMKIRLSRLKCKLLFLLSIFR